MDSNKSIKELRDENNLLFCSICKMYPGLAWKSRKSDLEELDIDEFIAGIYTPAGQATFHINTKYWDLFDVSELENASEFCDAYSSEEAIFRVLVLAKNIKELNEITRDKKNHTK